ncbi:PAS domain-containing protein [Quatrionicoccus australiensis]|uniref:PAS domain-containing protein n=1 Tax=Quatrionicoccus australiensis TaxID=138118 RepID=UPI001CFB407C|nr:PAS domain-containing protein [Quatrionicoccus australiensis]MCB4359885.1 PAS domain-containing protein [Quatrionicoccus australiensis]
MKRKIEPTTVERSMREDDFIVSKTTAKGIITYGNPIFIEFSGYTEAELLGTQHNIVRHPDMPRAAFKLAWDTIESGREFFGYVKNMAKDGSFYWVFTHITPDFDRNKRIVGYTSVRRCPRRDAISKIEPVYRQMLAAESAAGARDAIAAGTKVLLDLLQQTGMSYEELVFSL